MKETRIPNLNVDPVGIRLKHIIEEKKAGNEEALGKIKSLTESWEELNKTIETDIKDEFKLMDLEDQALAEALADLEENHTKPVKNAFTITGKARSKNEKIGLPNVTVTALHRVERKSRLLAKGVTDNLGNFVFRLRQKTLGGDNQAEMEVEYQVIAGDGTLLHSEIQTLKPRLSGIVRVTLIVAETDVVSNQLEAGKAVKDSIVDSRDLIASRVENMRGAHDALAKISGITRDEFDTLHAALAVPPPEVKDVITGPAPGEEGKSGPPTDEEAGPPEDTEEEREEEERERPPGTPPNLTAITGIGPQRAAKLKAANIKDIKTFIATDNRKLMKILGELDFEAMKIEARKLLERA